MVIAEDQDDIFYMLKKLHQEYQSWRLAITELRNTVDYDTIELSNRISLSIKIRKLRLILFYNITFEIKVNQDMLLQ